MIVSRDASDNFHRTSFQNKRFVRGFLQISQNKLPKRSFRAMLPTILTERASKTIVSCEASSKFHRTSFQNDRFARCFRQFSQRKLPKRSFRARLPPNLTEQASKTNVSCEASFKFPRTKLPKRTFRARGASDNFHRKFAFRHSFVPSTHRILREGSSSKSKMCVSLQRRAIPHFKIHVLRQRRTQKCMNQAQEARGNTRHTKITILPQFRTSDQHEVTRGLQNELQNSHFTSVLDDR